jgi:hypothetical protein
VHVHVKILDELPFQGCQTLEARAPIPVLAHSLYGSLEDQGGISCSLLSGFVTNL